MRRLHFDLSCSRFGGFVILLPLLLSLTARGGESSLRINLAEELTRGGYEKITLRRTAENHLFLFGKLNGRRHSVLVDTGWSFTTVSTNAARSLPAASEQGFDSQEPLLKTTSGSPVVALDRLALGNVMFTNQPAFAQHIVANGQRAPFDVVLGCDFFLRNFAVIDCLKNRLYVRHSPPSPRQQEDFEQTLRGSGLVAVPLERKRPLALTCPARVNGEPVEMLVDTAAVWSCLDARQSVRLGVRPLPTPRKIIGAGATGARPVSVAEVKTFAVGDFASKSASFALLDLCDWGLGSPGKGLSDVQGILGGAELAASGAVIDCHALKLWVKPARKR